MFLMQNLQWKVSMINVVVVIIKLRKVRPGNGRVAREPNGFCIMFLEIQFKVCQSWNMPLRQLYGLHNIAKRTSYDDSA